jgi:hypothetical protein
MCPDEHFARRFWRLHTVKNGERHEETTGQGAGMAGRGRNDCGELIGRRGD